MSEKKSTDDLIENYFSMSFQQTEILAFLKRSRSTVMATRGWMTEPDEYICALPIETQEIAKNELNEDKNRRDQALESMRQWIIGNRRIINCRLDAKFILKFLRFAKFNVHRAQETLERNLLVGQIFSSKFRNLDICEPVMQELVDTGFLFVCPRRDSHGRRLYFCRPGAFDLSKFTGDDILRLSTITFETLIEDEENQVRGLTYVADFRGVDLSYGQIFSFPEIIQIIRNMERTVPGRHYQAHIVNVHPSIKYLSKFVLSLLSDKIRGRIKIYSSVEELINSGNIDVDILPKEYGGVMPLKEMIALWKNELLKSNKLLLSYNHLQVDESMYSNSEREGDFNENYMVCGGNKHDVYGVSGSFKKLQVD